MVKRIPKIIPTVYFSTLFCAISLLANAQLHAQSIVGGCEAPSPPLHAKHQLVPGELLHYEINYFGMSQGEASFKTRATKGGFWVKTVGRLHLDGFFHVLDDINGRMVSYVNPKNGKPGRMYNHVYGGKKREIRESAVFSGKNEVNGSLLYKGRKRPATLKGTSEVVDGLSVMYFLRHRDFVQKEPFCFEVYHRRRLWRIEGQMTHQEQVAVKAGKGQALVLEATLRRLGGGKRQGAKQPVKLWLSNDSNRLPLKMETPIGFTDLRVELAGYKLSK